MNTGNHRMSSNEFEFLPRTGPLIGSRRLSETSGGSWTHTFPVTGEPTVTFPLAGAAESDEAVKSARTGFNTWQALSPESRRDILLKLAAVTAANDKELSAISAIESGVGARKYGEICANVLSYNAGWADKVGGEVVTGGVGNGFDYTLLEPHGIVAVLIPWNAPLVTMINVVAPALVAGNACVVKPSELAPFSCIRWAELCLEAGLPPGVVNVIPGGKEAGIALVNNPGVDFIHFTGSTETGRQIARLAANNLTPVALELGGRSANLVFDDADLELSARMGLNSILGLSGQACTAGARLLVQKGIYSAFIEKLCELVRAVAVGDPRERGIGLGPVISRQSADRIVAMIQEAVRAGARLAVGGSRVGGALANGFFVEPTVLVDVAPDAPISRNEVFGPVVIVTPFTDESEAIALANDTPYGLAGYVQTTSLKRAHKVAAALRAGMVYINGGLRAHPAGAPFGGRAASGYGRIGGRMGVEEFMHKKNVWLSL
jgi:aldehyde dehydrogenase (NAD+)